jgi:hypothetical protein
MRNTKCMPDPQQWVAKPKIQAHKTTAGNALRDGVAAGSSKWIRAL